MPLYEFDCPSCGPFDVFRPVSRAAEGVQCPDCSADAVRVWSAPAVAAMSPLGRMAAERNEQSSHAPHMCQSGCGCGKRKKSPPPDPRQMDQLNGRTRHVSTGSRPWVCEH